MSSSPRVFMAGAGFMGSGIAQTAAAHGASITLYDIANESLQKAEAGIRWSMEKLHGKNPDAWPTPDHVLKNIRFSSSLADAASCEIVIEAVAERLEIKTGLFAELDRTCPAETLFFTNTSAIPIRRLAAATQRADRFCGMHFFSPVPLMKLVEVIRGDASSDTTVARAMELARAWGKTPVEVKKDAPGFIVNRLLIAMLLEAVRLVEQGIASPASIDEAMRLGCGHKMGPLETGDMSGLDVFLHAAEAIYAETGDPKYLPPDLLKDLVKAGNLGRKTGQGITLGGAE